eukprot:3956833-Prymnesium_polylepis.2
MGSPCELPPREQQLVHLDAHDVPEVGRGRNVPAAATTERHGREGKVQETGSPWTHFALKGYLELYGVVGLVVGASLPVPRARHVGARELRMLDDRGLCGLRRLRMLGDRGLRGLLQLSLWGLR